jgi:hypothetical protein
MSHQRNRKRLLQWERYHARSRAMGAGPTQFVYYNGHVNAAWKVQHQGRYYPIGIRRNPWVPWAPPTARWIKVA